MTLLVITEVELRKQIATDLVEACCKARHRIDREDGFHAELCERCLFAYRIIRGQ